MVVKCIRVISSVNCHTGSCFTNFSVILRFVKPGYVRFIHEGEDWRLSEFYVLAKYSYPSASSVSFFIPLFELNWVSKDEHVLLLMLYIDLFLQILATFKDRNSPLCGITIIFMFNPTPGSVTDLYNSFCGYLY